MKRFPWWRLGWWYRGLRSNLLVRLAEFLLLPISVAAIAFWLIQGFDSNLERLCLVSNTAKHGQAQGSRKTVTASTPQQLTRYERRRHLLDDAVKVSGLLAAFAALLKFNHENARTRKERSIAHIDSFVDDFSKFENKIGKEVLKHGQYNIHEPMDDKSLKDIYHLLRHCESIGVAVRVGVIDQVVANDLLEDIFPRLLGYALPLVYEDLQLGPAPAHRKDNRYIAPNSTWCEFRMFCRILRDDAPDA